MFTTIKRIINWCDSFKGRLYTGFVFSFFSYWFTAMPIVIASLIIGKIIEEGKEIITPSYVWGSFCAILLFVALRFLFDYIRARFQETISYDLTSRDRLAIGDALKRVSLGYFQKVNTGSILNSITTGLNTLEKMGVRMIDTFIGGYLNFLAIFTGLVFLDVKVALISAVFAFVSFLFLVLVSKRSRESAPKEAEISRKLTSAALEYARGLPVIKSLSCGKDVTRVMDEAIRESKDIHLKIEWAFISPDCLHLLALKCGSVAMAFASCIGIFNEDISLSSGLMLIFFSLNIFINLEPISDSAHVLGIIDNAMDQLDMLKKENFIDGDGKDIPLKNFDIEYKNVSFGYDERRILKDVSFKIKENTSTAIVGPSGSGKTTLVNLLARFYDVDDGSISIGGHDLREFTCDSLLSNISMVFQNVYLFNDTVRNNICFGKENAAEEEMIEAAKKACCHDFIMELPNGYDTVIGEGGGTLSGGEKQRISIARAILKNAPVIILDEATASIDPENEHLIQEAISQLTKGKTIITIAHRLATIENADKIIVLEDGRVTETGTHQELIKNDGLYKRFIEKRRKAEGWSIE